MLLRTIGLGRICTHADWPAVKSATARHAVTIHCFSVSLAWHKQAGKCIQAPGHMRWTEFGERLEWLLPRGSGGCRNKQAAKNHRQHILQMRSPATVRIGS